MDTAGRRTSGASVLATRWWTNWAFAGALVVSAVAAGCTGATHVDVTVASSPNSVQSVAAPAPKPTVPIPACVASLPVEAKAAQLLMVLVEHPLAAKDAVATGLVGGYALVTTQRGDVTAEINEVAASSKLPVFASGDEEGGTVQRFRDILGPLPAASELAASVSPENAGTVLGEYAARLKQLGLNMNLGPSIDVGSGSALRTRSFGDDPAKVSAYGLAVIAAVQGAGVIPVAKHWPGIGGGKADPHLSAAPIAGIATLRARDLLPFQDAIAANVPAIMVSHAIVPDLTDGLPASLSRAAITGELRERQGFDGLVITDSLGMGAISLQFDDARAAVTAIAAGADIALLSTPAKAAAARQGIVDAIASGSIPGDQIDRSVGRVLTAKGVTGPCPV